MMVMMVSIPTLMTTDEAIGHGMFLTGIVIVLGDVMVRMTIMNVSGRRNRG